MYCYLHLAVLHLITVHQWEREGVRERELGDIEMNCCQHLTALPVPVVDWVVELVPLYLERYFYMTRLGLDMK